MTVRELYNENPEKEWNRLSGQSIEFAVTAKVLDKYIKPGSSVLDIGGGPGRYSIYYCQKGCFVTLVDLAENNVKYAMERYNQSECSGRLLGIKSDVLFLDQQKLSQYDNVIMLGPMYCLKDAQSRGRALYMAIDHVKPGGYVFIGYCNIFGPLNYAAKNLINSLDRWGAELDELTTGLLTGLSLANPSDSFVRYYSHPHEIEDTFKYFCNVDTVEIFGQEGFMSQSTDRLKDAMSEMFQKWVGLCTKVCDYPDVWKTAEHVVVVGRKR